MTKDTGTVSCFEISPIPSIKINATHEQIMEFYALAQNAWITANRHMTRELKNVDESIKKLKTIPEETRHETLVSKEVVNEIVSKLDSNLAYCDKKIREFQKLEESESEKDKVITNEEYLEALNLSFRLLSAYIFVAQLSTVEPIVTSMKRLTISKKIMKKKGYVVK